MSVPPTSRIEKNDNGIEEEREEKEEEDQGFGKLKNLEKIISK